MSLCHLYEEEAEGVSQPSGEGGCFAGWQEESVLFHLAKTASSSPERILTPDLLWLTGTDGRSIVRAPVCMVMWTKFHPQTARLTRLCMQPLYSPCLDDSSHAGIQGILSYSRNLARLAYIWDTVFKFFPNDLEKINWESLWCLIQILKL